MFNGQKSIQVVAALFKRKTHSSETEVLVFQRKKDDIGSGIWEFPGGKIEPAESREQALVREIQEELEVNIHILGYVGENTHSYPNLNVTIHLFHCEPQHWNFKLNDHDDMKWVNYQQIQNINFAEADRPFLEKIFS